jgi:hypothetical protein
MEKAEKKPEDERQGMLSERAASGKNMAAHAYVRLVDGT